MVPIESQHFEFYPPSNDTRVVPLRDSPMYQGDWLGLKTLDRAGRLIFIQVPGGHIEYETQWSENLIWLNFMLVILPVLFRDVMSSSSASLVAVLPRVDILKVESSAYFRDSSIHLRPLPTPNFYATKKLLKRWALRLTPLAQFYEIDPLMSVSQS